MALDPSALAELCADVDRFHLRDARVIRAQRAMLAALARAGGPRKSETAAYLRALQRYFAPFSKEAAARLADVERRLARANALQFNLTAERGVAAERVVRVRGVVDRIENLVRE